MLQQWRWVHGEPTTPDSVHGVRGVPVCLHPKLALHWSCSQTSLVRPGASLSNLVLDEARSQLLVLLIDGWSGSNQGEPMARCLS